MAKRTAIEARNDLRARGIDRGVKVTWKGWGQDRFGVVAETSDYEMARGNARVLASNGSLHIPHDWLSICPGVWDVFKADVEATYPERKVASNG